MGSIRLLVRLARRDLRRQRWESLLLLTALTMAATSLVLGFALHARIAAPYAQTRAATHGPDVVAGVLPEPRTVVTGRQREQLSALLHDRDVRRFSGPFPTTWTAVAFGHVRGAAEVQGRDRSAAPVDQPKVTAGGWIQPGAAVLEQAFANALGAHVGSTLVLGGRMFRIAGIAVTAAVTPYPDVCFVGCTLATQTLSNAKPGLIWLTHADARSLATRTEPVALTASLTLRRGVDADDFVAAHSRDSANAPLLTSWKAIANHDGKLVRNVRVVILLGGSLLSLLAIATVAVLVGNRLSEETRRIGTLKAIGATPAYVSTILLAQYVLVAVIATAIGAALAWALAPQLQAPSAGLLGSAAGSSVTPLTVGTALAVVVGVTAVATASASLRAIHASTVSALTALTRRARRRPMLIALSATLPTAGLIGLRLVARRPRRSLLTAAGIAVAATGLVAVVLANARLTAEQTHLTSGLPDPNTARLDQVMLAITVLLIVLAVVDIVFVAAATTADAQASLAVIQALGASPAAKLAAIAVALALPAACGAAIGLPAGLGLFAVLNHSNTATPNPVITIAAILPTTVIAAVVLAATTAHLNARRTIADILQSESA